MDTLKINIDREKRQISVYNNGRGIPVEKHKKEGIMIPELIFGHLSVKVPRLEADDSLTSSNYDDDQKKLTGGRNGYGAKLTNIYSTEFSESATATALTLVVETADKTNSLKYKQVFSDNMGKKASPKASCPAPPSSTADYTKSER